MRKRGNRFALINLILGLMMLNFASAATLFSDGFGNGLDWTTSLPAGWTASDDATSGMDDQLSITGGSDGNRYAWISGNTGDQDITRPSISTAGFQNINIIYVYNLIGSFASTDFLVVEWKDSADASYTLIQKVTGTAGWNTAAFNLPASASDTTIDLRFRADDTESSDYILIDNVQLNGSSIENCGNGVLNSGEQCDDGNQNNNDACTNTCTLTFCGNGATQQPNGVGNGGPQNDGIEACDDGDLDNNDDCDNNCISTTQGNCGDGNVDAGEQCDDGNTANGDGCDSTCQVEEPVCGNNVLESGEECDDGNTANGDGCDSNCQVEQPAVCGNNILEQGEECDDGNAFNGDGCNMFCQEEFCGDGIEQFTLSEQCDDGNLNNHDDCTNLCLDPFCGDGFLWIDHEECDDGNTASGDGCNSTCKFEPTGQCFAPVDVMLVIDRSGSMDDNCGPDGIAQPGETPCNINDAKSAAITFVNQVNFSNDQVGLASFNQTAVLNQGLTNNLAAITAAINALKAGGATNIGDGIKVGREELVAFGGPTKAMILLSDGAPNVMTFPNGSQKFCFVDPQSPTDCTIYAANQSNITKLAGIEIFTIGLGVNNFTENLLKEIATTPSNYFSAPNSTQLEAIYLQIAQEICPCEGFDCSINTDACNFGFCNLDTDQCDFQPEQLSTSCEEDGNLCGIDHCDGEGACVPLSEVNCDEINGPCQQGTCDQNTGLCGADPLPASTPCATDQTLCTTQHCDGSGNCVELSSTDCSGLDTNCQDGVCNPNTGNCESDFFDLSTPCQADNSLCTIDHCDGSGNCILQNNKDCSVFNDQCNEGICIPETGNCEPDPFDLSTFCEVESNLCTLDHCNGFGLCTNFGDVPVPQPTECKSFSCNPLTGQIDTTNSQLSTLCVTDDSECTIQHCDGQGNCVNNPGAELPPDCLGEIIKDAKVAQALPKSNFGLGKYMIVNPKTGAIDRAYFRIDASAVNSPITNANLKVYVYQTGGSATGSNIDAYYCRDHDFVETTINWNNQPLDGICSLADSFTVPNEVVAGSPESFHIFDLANETNFEIASGDGSFTVVLRSALENTGVPNHAKHVQYIAREYPDSAFRPKFEIS